jgi:hypothetical protein
MSLIKKDDVRKAEIITAVKASQGDSIKAGWDQESNAIAILNRIAAIAKRNGLALSIEFVKDMAADVLCGGIGLYGNASQFKQVLEGKAKTPEASGDALAAMLSKYVS